MDNSNKKTIRRAFVSSLPVFTGYITLGIAFGVLLKTNGYGALWALGMSVFIFAGSMQFVGIGLLTSGASLISVAVTTLLVNARHLFYGLSMIDKYRNMGAAKPYLISALTDETYSLVCSGIEDIHPENKRLYYLTVSLLNHLYWITGSVIGALLGAVIPFNTKGIDFAMTALFVTIVTEQWLTAKEHFPAISGAAATILCLICFGPDSFLIPSMAAITLLLLSVRGRIEVTDKA